jgi:hypothetical protein
MALFIGFSHDFVDAVVAKPVSNPCCPTTSIDYRFFAAPAMSVRLWE